MEIFTVFYFSESNIDWKQLPGAAVEISAKGRELWVINSAQKIYRWDGSNWELKPGAAVRLGTSPDGWTWVVNSNDNIFRWNVDLKNWDLMPGALVQVSAISKDLGKCCELRSPFQRLFKNINSPKWF